MAEFAYPELREQLLRRRQRLEEAAAAGPGAEQLLELIGEVDAALARIGNGTYGLCETCHEPIEQERLLADPLARVCVDHLSKRQRRELELDLQLASRIQAGLLPPNDFRRNGWEVSYYYEAAGAVSGDYCDLVSPPGTGDLFLFVGDISGKGVAASLLMSHLHAIVRTLLEVGTPLSPLMERAGRLFCQSTPSSHYATLAGVRAAPSGEVELANAGHCRPALVRSGRAALIEDAGLPLGLFCDSQYPTVLLRLEPGDSLVLYTDGLSEARNAGGEEYGTERLMAAAAGSYGSAAGLAAACVADQKRFLAGAARNDDLTVLAVHRTAPEPRA